MTGANQTPLLLRAARGESVERTPVWMMRQAGRYMKIYRDLRDKYPSFRDRSEKEDLAVEISLQPWRAFQPDGVILFSDILTPLPAIGIPFDIIESRGPVIDPAIRSQAQIDSLHDIDLSQVGFVGNILKTLRAEVGNQSTVLGFVGAPWTLAAYAIEGKSSKDYVNIKTMAFCEPQMLHSLLTKIADGIATYLSYQIESGAQVVQMFDSWAGQLSPTDYQTFALPYQKMVVEKVKAKHPDTPMILYINGSAGVLELLGQSGVDIVSVDWTVNLSDARQRIGTHLGVQGNMDPCALYGSQAFIQARILDTIRQGGGRKHIMNLGHGVLPTTPEDNVRFFFETAKNANALLGVAST
jgi:uroporphyrinogen decarboxylase